MLPLSTRRRRSWAQILQHQATNSAHIQGRTLCWTVLDIYGGAKLSHWKIVSLWIHGLEINFCCTSMSYFIQVAHFLILLFLWKKIFSHISYCFIPCFFTRQFAFGERFPCVFLAMSADSGCFELLWRKLHQSKMLAYILPTSVEGIWYWYWEQTYTVTATEFFEGVFMNKQTKSSAHFKTRVWSWNHIYIFLE